MIRLFFDDALPRINSAEIKHVAKLWGGNYKMRKDECLACISAGLRNPDKVRAAVAGLEPWEKNALALIKQAGGVIMTDGLMVGLLATGTLPARYKSEPSKEVASHLFRRGLILSRNTYSPDQMSNYYARNGGVEAYSDARLLDHAGLPTFEPFSLPAKAASGEIHARRPQAVALDVVGILQAIANMGGLKLTREGSLRVSDEAKFRKAMRWKADELDVDGFKFPDPAQAWIEALYASDLFIRDDAQQLLTLAEPVERFTQRDYLEQVRILLDGIIRTQKWSEIHFNLRYVSDGGAAFRQQARQALILTLTALPRAAEGYYPLADFERALYERIGENFSLEGPPNRPYSFYNRTAAEQKQELSAWQQKVRAEWVKREYRWIAAALSTWLYFLGLVELEMNAGRLEGFRLSEMGWQALHPELDGVSAAPAPSAEDQPAWVVQPNFDLIVYLDRASPAQLTFLERHAERTETHKNTAHYRLTRESVYRGLESGTTLDELIEGLQSGSHVALAQNVAVELREWAALRERITLRRAVRLLEFPSPNALQAGLARGLQGRVVGERFLLLPAAHPEIEHHLINYAAPLPANLSASETGLIHWKRTPADLITAATLGKWAQPTQDDGWQLTRESVSTMLKSGKKISELLNLLRSRLKHLPPLLELALQTWANVKYGVELEAVIILQCPQEKVFQVILSSPLMLSYLDGYLYPAWVFVKRDRLEEFRQRLQWIGLDVSEKLTISKIIHAPPQ